MADSIPYESLHDHPATVRQRRSQQLSTLRGIIEGLAADQQINERERQFLDHWIAEHAAQAEQAHYSKLITYIHNAIADNIITKDEQVEILEHIQELNGDAYYNLFTNAMQEFHGIMGGIASDGRVTAEELRTLRDWMEDHQDLAGHWPFTETDSLLTSILADGIVDADEHQRMLAWCGSFVDISTHKTLVAPATGFGSEMQGIAAVAPVIIFAGRSFCVTGASARAKRREIQQQIADLGGMISDGIRQDLNYLVYCDAGQKCWAYACYGRKVERVMENRKAGVATTLIIAEADYWDALADHGVEQR